MPDELLRSLRIPVPQKGLVEGINPASPLFPPDAASDLLNLRILNGAWETRKGMTLWDPDSSGSGTFGGSGDTHWLANFHLSTGGRFRLIARGGVLYDLQQGSDTVFQSVTDGTGLSTSPRNGVYNGVQLRDRLYITDRAGALKYYTSALSATGSLTTVAQPTAPTVAPNTRRRTWAVLEDWPGSAGSSPTGWTEEDGSNFSIDVAGTGTAVPTFFGTAIAEMIIDSSGSRGDSVLENWSVGEELASHSIVFFFRQGGKRHFVNFEIGTNAAGEFTFPIDPPEGSQNYLFFCPIGNLPLVKYKRFRVVQTPDSARTLYVSQLLLPGRLEGKYRYHYTFATTAGAESEPSPATEFVDCSAIGINYKSEGTDALEKSVELDTGSQSLPSVSSVTRVKWYRNGGIPALTKDQRGQDVYYRVGTTGHINATLAAGVSAGATSLTCATGNGAANLTAGDYIVLDRGVAGAQEHVIVEAVTTGSPNDTIRVYKPGGLVTVTDLVIDGSTNTDVTSASRPFTSADIGKTVRITAGTGFTAGYYTISSIPAGTTARLSGAAGTTGSTGGTAKVMTGIVNAHDSGDAITPGLIDNTANESVDSTTRLEIERDDPPTGIHWLAVAPDGRLWAFRHEDGSGNDRPLSVAVSNRPTADRLNDQDVFPDGVDPLTRGSLIQGWRFDLQGHASGDEIMWAGFFGGVATILTRRAVFRVSAYSQADWTPSAIVKAIDGVGCVAGETVQEIDGWLYWVADGPRVVRWNGRDAPEDLSYLKLTTTLGAAPAAYVGQWFARGFADKNSKYYKLFMTPSGGTTNTLLLDFNILGGCWEPVIYNTGSDVAWATALVWDGPNDAREIYAATPAGGLAYQLESGLTDAGTAIVIRATSARHVFPDNWLARGEKAWLRATPSGADTLSARIRMGGSEYRNVTTFSATDGDPFQSWNETLSDSDTSELEFFQRLNFYALKGRWLELRLSGSVSNRPAVREALVDYSLVRRSRITA